MNRSPEKFHPKRGHLFLLVSCLGLILLGGTLLQLENRLKEAQISSKNSTEEIDFFRDQVFPVIRKNCASCHGLLPQKEEKEKGKSRLTQVSPELFRYRMDQSGAPLSDHEMGRLHRLLREKIQNKPLHLPQFHPFLKLTLGEKMLGVFHPEIFSSVNEPDAKVLLRWIGKLSSNLKPFLADDPLLTTFKERIYPLLFRKGCIGCHGPLAFNDFKMDPSFTGMDPKKIPGHFFRDNLSRFLKGETRMVSQESPEGSRQILKNIPLEEGGIPHKGGNHFFKRGDPDFMELQNFIVQLTSSKNSIPPLPENLKGAILYVQSPKGHGERPLLGPVFSGGSDLFLLSEGKTHNLTSRFHPATEVDIRQPELSPDGTRVVFAMAHAFDSPFNLYQLDLQTLTLQQLTFSENRKIHYLTPLYVPAAPGSGGDDKNPDLVLISNRLEESCIGAPAEITLEAESGDLQEIRDQQLTEAQGRWSGLPIRVVAGTNQGYRGRIKKSLPGKIFLEAPAEKPFDSTSHYVITDRKEITSKFDLFRLPLPKEGQERENFKRELKRISFSPEQVYGPTLRSSGEIFFTAVRSGSTRGRPYFNGAIYRTHFDGSNFHVHGGNRSGIPLFLDNREFSSGIEVRTGQGTSSFWGGALFIVDHQFGPALETTNPYDSLDHPPFEKSHSVSSLPRFIQGWINPYPKVQIAGLSPGGAFRHPYPLPDGGFLVSFASGPLDLDSLREIPDFDLVKISPDPSYFSMDGLGSGRVKMTPILQREGSQLWPRMITQKPLPGPGKPMNPAKEFLGPPEEINGFNHYPASVPAILQVNHLPTLSAFTSDTTPAGLRHTPENPCGGCGLDHGDLWLNTGFRVLTLEKGKGEGEKIQLWAEGALASDGSFSVEIPAQTGFDYQPLNPRKMALGRGGRWLYALPGEKHILSISPPLFTQTCAGCHGSFTGKPLDALPGIDGMTSASSVESAYCRESNLYRFPSNFGEKPPKNGLNLFNEQILPVVQKKCLPCHDSPGGGINFGESPSQIVESLLKFNVFPESPLALESSLLEKLGGEELNHPDPIRGESPHPAKNPLTSEEFLQWVRWIDLGGGAH